MIFSLLPYTYLAVLLSVIIHEFVGHGLVSLALGGTFDGVVLCFDGMGWASITPSSRWGEWEMNVMLMCGSLSTSVSGLLLLGIGYRTFGRRWVSLPILIIAFGVALGGIPYIFWNAVHPVPPGDIGRILINTGSTGLRITMILVAGLLLVACIVSCTFVFFLELQAWLTDGGVLRGNNRRFLALATGGLIGLSWFAFDYNQLVPGIGRLPSITALILHLISAGLIIRYKSIKFRQKTDVGQKHATIIGWVAILLVIAIVARCRYGYYF